MKIIPNNPFLRSFAVLTTLVLSLNHDAPAQPAPSITPSLPIQEVFGHEFSDPANLTETNDTVVTAAAGRGSHAIPVTQTAPVTSYSYPATVETRASGKTAIGGGGLSAYNSNSIGQGYSYGNANVPSAKLMATLATSYNKNVTRWYNLSLAGITTTQMIADAPSYVDPFWKMCSGTTLKNGSSGKSVGFVAWSSGHEVKLSEMEEDGSAVVLEGAEASGVGFDGLDPAVEGLG